MYPVKYDVLPADVDRERYPTWRHLAVGLRILPAESCYCRRRARWRRGVNSLPGVGAERRGTSPSCVAPPVAEAAISSLSAQLKPLNSRRK
jgi:hypothetical protein